MSDYLFTFKQWYEQLEGKEIQLDSLNRWVMILNERDEIVGKANFAKDLPSEISVDELLQNNLEQGDYVYFIMLNGYNSNNYLYRREFTLIL